MPIEIKKIDRKTVQGTWEKRVLFGQEIEVQIRPKTHAILNEIREEHKKKIDGVDTYDEIAIRDATIDYLVQDFKGIEEDGKPVDVNLETKKALLYMELPFGEISNYIWVIDKAVNLGVQVREAIYTN